MFDHLFSVKLTLIGPFLTQSAEAARFGIDASFLRDERGRPQIPATLVKGCLREAIEEILPDLGLPESHLDRWFGQSSPEGSFDFAARGRLEFSDLATEDLETETEPQSKLRFRVGMDPERGAAARGALAALETPFPAGKEVGFSGRIRAILPTEEAEELFTALRAGFRWIPALGAHRGVGFGQIVGADVRRETPAPVPVPASSASGPPAALEIAVRPEAPLCIGRHTPTENLFDSEEVIPGGALKGALAGTLNRLLDRPPEGPLDESLPPPWTALGRHFHRIRFSHAFPAARSENPDKWEKRPLFPPLTTVRAGGKTHDVALGDGPGTIDGHVPAFAADWKPGETETVWSEFGWPNAVFEDRDIRVHTAMDPDTRRSRAAALFAVTRIRPERLEWLGRVDLTGVPEEEREEAAAALHALLDFGIVGLGKTKTRAAVQCRESQADGAQPISPLDSSPRCQWVVCLQTPALMANPEALAGDRCTAENLKAEYQQYWQEISHGNLALVDFFARQELRGRYISFRFLKGQNKPYNPFSLTAPGSVFLLKAGQNPSDSITEASRILGEWVRNGLPTPGWAVARYGQSWKGNPFLPENGYGEIAVNLPGHQKESLESNNPPEAS